MDKHQFLKRREERETGKWLEGHKQYLRNTNTFRKYGGVPDSQGRVHDLNAKGKALQRKINSPLAKEKRALRHDRYEGHENAFTTRRLAHISRR